MPPVSDLNVAGSRDPDPDADYGRERAEIPADHATAATAFIEELVEVMGSVGRHEGHSLSRVGRCVYCSCNYRYQGSLPSAKDRADARDCYAEMQAGRSPDA